MLLSQEEGASYMRDRACYCLRRKELATGQERLVLLLHLPGQYGDLREEDISPFPLKDVLQTGHT